MSHGKNGQYTLRSAYEAMTRQDRQVEKRESNKEETSCVGEKERAWKQLWKIRIKQKQKLFRWKCLHYALPTREIIFKRTGKGDLICKNCGEDVETMEHISFQCRRAGIILQMASLQWDGLKRNVAPPFF